MSLAIQDIERLADAVAERVARRLREQAPQRFVDAATLARVLGVKRDWIYAHAEELGGVRLGSPQGRLRFDVAALSGRLPPVASDTLPTRSAPARQRRATPRRRGRLPAGSAPVRLIPYEVEWGPEHKAAGRRGNADPA